MVTQVLLCGLGSLVCEWHFLFPKARAPTTPRPIYATQDSEGRRVFERTSTHNHIVRTLWAPSYSNMIAWPVVKSVVLRYWLRSASLSCYFVMCGSTYSCDLLSIWRILKPFVTYRIQFYSIRVLLPLFHISTLEKIKNQERREKKKKIFKDDNRRHRFHLPAHITIMYFCVY